MALFRDKGDGQGFGSNIRRVFISKPNASKGGRQEWHEWKEAWRWSEAKYKAAYDSTEGTDAEKEAAGVAAGWQKIFGGSPGDDVQLRSVFVFGPKDWIIGNPDAVELASSLDYELVKWPLDTQQNVVVNSPFDFEHAPWGLATPVEASAASSFDFGLVDFELPLNRSRDASSSLNFLYQPWFVGFDPRPTILGPEIVQFVPGRYFSAEYVLDGGTPPRNVRATGLPEWATFTRLTSRRALLAGRAPSAIASGTEFPATLHVVDNASPPLIGDFDMKLVARDPTFDITGPTVVDVPLGHQFPATSFLGTDGTRPYDLDLDQAQGVNLPTSQIGDDLIVGPGSLPAGHSVGTSYAMLTTGTDSSTPPDSASHAWTIRVVPEPYAFDGPTTIRVVEGAAFPDTVYTASGGTPPDTMAMENDSGLSLAFAQSGRTGTLSGSIGAAAEGSTFQVKLTSTDSASPSNAEELDVTIAVIGTGVPFEARLDRSFETHPGTSDSQDVLPTAGTGPYTHRVTSSDPSWGSVSISGATVTVTANGDAPRGSEHTVAGESTDARGATATWSAKWTVPHLALRGRFFPSAMALLQNGRGATDLIATGGVSGPFSVEQIGSPPSWLTVSTSRSTIGDASTTFHFDVSVAADAPARATYTDRWRVRRGAESVIASLTVTVTTPPPTLSLPDFDLGTTDSGTKPYVLEHALVGFVELEGTTPSWLTITIDEAAKTITATTTNAPPLASATYSCRYRQGGSPTAYDTANVNVVFEPIEIGGSRTDGAERGAVNNEIKPVTGGSGGYASVEVQGESWIRAVIDGTNAVVIFRPPADIEYGSRHAYRLRVIDDQGNVSEWTDFAVVINNLQANLPDVTVNGEPGDSVSFDFDEANGLAGTYTAVTPLTAVITMTASTGAGSVSIPTTQGLQTRIVQRIKFTADTPHGSGLENASFATLTVLVGDPLTARNPPKFLVDRYGLTANRGLDPYIEGGKGRHRVRIAPGAIAPSGVSVSSGTGPQIRIENIQGDGSVQVEAYDESDTPQTATMTVSWGIKAPGCQQLSCLVGIDSDGFIPMRIFGEQHADADYRFQNPVGGPDVIGAAPGGKNVIGRKTAPHETGSSDLCENVGVPNEDCTTQAGKAFTGTIDIVDHARNREVVHTCEVTYYLAPTFDVSTRIGCQHGTTCRIQLSIVGGCGKGGVDGYDDEVRVCLFGEGAAEIPEWIRTGGRWDTTTDCGTGLGATTIIISPPRDTAGRVISGTEIDLGIQMTGSFDLETINPSTGDIEIRKVTGVPFIFSRTGGERAVVEIGVIEVEPVKIVCTTNVLTLTDPPNFLDPPRTYTLGEASSRIGEPTLQCDEPWSGQHIDFGTGGLRAGQIAKNVWKFIKEINILRRALGRPTIPPRVPGGSGGTWFATARGELDWRQALVWWIGVTAADIQQLDVPFQCAASDDWSYAECTAYFIIAVFE